MEEAEEDVEVLVLVELPEELDALPEAAVAVVAAAPAVPVDPDAPVDSAGVPVEV